MASISSDFKQKSQCKASNGMTHRRRPRMSPPNPRQLPVDDGDDAAQHDALPSLILTE